MLYAWRITLSAEHNKGKIVNGREYISSYVDKNGGLRPTAKKLGIPYSSLAAIINGYRGIGKNMALRITKASRGELKPEHLIWIKQTKRQKTA